MSSFRKLAADLVGRSALDERFGPPQLSALDSVLLKKAASADPALLKVAATFDTGNPLDTYEAFGGSYSSAVKE